MITARTLLTLTLGLGLAAPALAQVAPSQAPLAAPAPAPAAAPAVAPTQATAAPEAAPADTAAAPVPATDAPGVIPPPETAPIPEPTPLLAPAAPPPAPVATPAPAVTPAPTPAPTPKPALAAPPPDMASLRAMEADASKPDCVKRKICIGPVLTLGVINAFGFGAHARLRDNWGIGIDYQFVPTFTVGDQSASANWSLFTVEGRWYPLGGAFFFDLGFGYQTFAASVTQQMPVPIGSPVSVTMRGSMHIPALKLGLGFMGRSGFVMGIDLGLYIPLGGREVEFDAPTSSDPSNPASLLDVASLRKDISDAANKVVKLLPFVPQLNLLRVGYLF